MPLENQTNKTKLRMPEASQSARLEEVMLENQQNSFLKNHFKIDKFYYEGETLTIQSYLTGRYYFLHPQEDKLDYMGLRLGVEINIYKNCNYYCEIVVNKYVIRHGNKIIYFDDFGQDSEEDQQYKRTFVVEAPDFINLCLKLNSYFVNIFYDTIGVPEPSQYPIIVMDNVGEEITKAHYEFNDDDSEEIQNKKMEIEKMLRDTYEQRFKLWAISGAEMVNQKVTGD